MQKVGYTFRKIFREKVNQNDEDRMSIEGCRESVTSRPFQAKHIRTTVHTKEAIMERTKTMAGEQLPCEQETR